MRPFRHGRPRPDLFIAPSRNYALGVALGASRTAPVATQEGAATAVAALSLSRETGARTPIIETVEALVEGRLLAAEASAALLSRPLTSES